MGLKRKNINGKDKIKTDRSESKGQLDKLTSKRIYVLTEDVNFFGKIIKRGTVYKQNLQNKDYYICNCEEDGIQIIKPSFNLHFKIVEHNPMFIKTFAC